MQREQRRLAAIVSADVAGYSRLMGRDESGTLAALKALRREIVDPAIASHDGRIVKTTGDGLLLEFPSVVNAVRCAVAVQTAMAAKTAAVPEDRRLAFRVGINIGDIIADGDDIFGDGVNVAARLQEIAPPGGVCVSARVHEDVRDRLDDAFEDSGPQALKNIARPVEVWRWSPQRKGPAAPSIGAAPPLALPDKPSIAVLPFQNMSGDPEQEYFADGMVEDIITALSRFKSLFVIARNSSFTYKNKAIDIRQVGRDLGVRYVLEGSVRKAGDRLRITSQLIDASTGEHIWAERFDRRSTDIFDIQDELTAMIVGALEPAIGTEERRRASAKRLETPGAWDLYQRGMWHLHRRSAANLEDAQRLFARAIEIDPCLVPAFSGVAECCFFQIVDGAAEHPAQLREKGLHHARRAVDLDKLDAGARYALGRMYVVRREADLAIPQLQEAIELNPNFAWAHYALGFAFGVSGQPQLAAAPIQRAMRLSPHDPYKGQFMVHLGLSCLLQGQHEEALEWAEKSLREPNIQLSRRLLLIAALGFLGQQERAQHAVMDLLAGRPTMTVGLADELWPLSDPRSRHYVMEGWRRARLPD